MVYQYPHPEYFRDWNKPDFLVHDRSIILWGAGKVGGVAAHCLKKRGVLFEAFCDIAKDKWGTEFCGHPVISPEELQKYYPNAIVLISAVFYDSIRDSLEEMGYQDYYDCSALFMEIDFSDYDFWASKEYSIRNIEQYLSAILEQRTSGGKFDQIFLNITTRCTLRCKECSLFIPYVDKPCDYPSREIMDDLHKTLDALGHVRIVNFYGGEPLLHPDLAQMIRKLKNEKRIDRISIITNATIVPSDEVLSAIADEERFLFRISDYGSTSCRLREICVALQGKDIRYEIANYTYWDHASTIRKTNDTEEQLVKKFKLCTACNNMFMINRRGYLCSTGSAVCNMCGFPESPSNYIDMSDDNNFSERMKKFVARPYNGQYMDACRYCSGTHGVNFEDKIPVAEQTREKLSFPRLD